MISCGRYAERGKNGVVVGFPNRIAVAGKTDMQRLGWTSPAFIGYDGRGSPPMVRNPPWFLDRA
jgi:hypothetical protein